MAATLVLPTKKAGDSFEASYLNKVFQDIATQINTLINQQANASTISVRRLNGLPIAGSTDTYAINLDTSTFKVTGEDTDSPLITATDFFNDSLDTIVSNAKTVMGSTDTITQATIALQLLVDAWAKTITQYTAERDSLKDNTEFITDVTTNVLALVQQKGIDADSLFKTLIETTKFTFNDSVA